MPRTETGIAFSRSVRPLELGQTCSVGNIDQEASTSISGGSSQGVIQIICPYCEKKMIKGYVQSSRKVFWSQEKRKIFIIPHQAKGDIPIISSLNSYYKEALLCENCQKIIINL